MKNITFILIFLISILGYSQIISGKITDIDNKPISGARIGIENTDFGDQSDENGNFEIDFTNFDKNSNIKVLISEFQPYKIKILDFINSDKKIVLTEKIVNIEPVNINPKKYKFKNFGTSNAKTIYCGYDSEKKDKLFREYAIKVENRKHLTVKKINVNIVNDSFIDSATLIFDVQGSKNDFPDDTKSLTSETLKFTFTKNDIVNKKISLDVSDQNIWTNEDFFVLVRVEDNLKGKLYFGGNIFAFSKNTYYRNYYGEWKKYSAGEPSINVDVQIEK